MTRHDYSECTREEVEAALDGTAESLAKARAALVAVSTLHRRLAVRALSSAERKCILSHVARAVDAATGEATASLRALGVE